MARLHIATAQGRKSIWERHWRNQHITRYGKGPHQLTVINSGSATKGLPNGINFTQFVRTTGIGTIELQLRNKRSSRGNVLKTVLTGLSEIIKTHPELRGLASYLKITNHMVAQTAIGYQKSHSTKPLKISIEEQRMPNGKTERVLVFDLTGEAFNPENESHITLLHATLLIEKLPQTYRETLIRNVK